jgi:hypothetical protein
MKPTTNQLLALQLILIFNYEISKRKHDADTYENMRITYDRIKTINIYI